MKSLKQWYLEELAREKEARRHDEERQSQRDIYAYEQLLCPYCNGKGGWSGTQRMYGYDIDVDVDCDVCDGTGKTKNRRGKVSE